ncbi:MAG: HipA family kinase [Ignavibacteriaceae bacterium]
MSLSTKIVISVIEEKVGTAHSPLKIISDDFCEYYLKAPKNQTPELSIIKEFLISYLLNYWSLKTPEVAALKLDRGIINKPLSAFHNASDFDRTCFGSKVIPINFEFSSILKLINKHDFNRFVNPDDILKLGLFDIWVENDDRKPSNPNLLLSDETNGFDFYAIDHAFTFSTVKFTDLDPLFDLGCSFNDSILYTDFSQSVFKYMFKGNPYWFDVVQDYFYLAIKKCQNNYHSIIENIPSDLGFDNVNQIALSNFLFSESRNKRVFDEFRGRFQL